MSDSGNNKQSNINCITVDSNFASATTCLAYYNLCLEQLKSNIKTADFFLVEDSKDYECLTLPIGLRDLSQIVTDFTKHKDDYASDRAKYETSAYSYLMLPPTNPAYSSFYSGGYYRSFENSVVERFSTISLTTIKILSQISYASLSQQLVNFLLKRKPDGSKNIVRRVKINPDTIIYDENGKMTSFKYYTESEIEEHKNKLIKESLSEADTLNYLNVEYIPSTFFETMLILSVLTNCSSKNGKTIPLDFDVSSIFPLDHPDENAVEIFKFFINQAQKDLEIIDIMENKMQGKFLLKDVIHADITGDDIKNNSKFFNGNLSVRDIYISYLTHLKYIILLAVPLIEISRNLSPSTSIVEMQKMAGQILDDEYSGYIKNMEDYMTNYNILLSYLNEETILFNMPGNVAKYLVYFIALKFSSSYKEDGKFIFSELNPQSKKFFSIIADLFSIGKESNTNPFFEMFFSDCDTNSFLDLINLNQDNEYMEKNSLVSLYKISKNKSTCEIILSELSNVLMGKKDNINVYIYRTANNYLTSDLIFKKDIALIVRTVNYFLEKNVSSRKNNSMYYDISNTSSVFSTELLLDTVKKITGLHNFDMKNEPFLTYQNVVNKKITSNEDKLDALAKNIDEKFGESFHRHYIDMPPIPYDDEEIRWAKRKCEDLKIKIEAIFNNTTNKDFDWNIFRESFTLLKEATNSYATSLFDDPDMVLNIKNAEVIFNDLCSNCGLDSRDLESLIKYEDSLYYYSHLDKIRFEFKPFEFKFNSRVGLDMLFNISNCDLLIKDDSINKKVLKSVQLISKSYAGKEELEKYFRPFFIKFSKTNKESFKVECDISEMETKAGIMKMRVMLKVTFGCTADLHECSKFRTFFYSISNMDDLFEQTKILLKIDQDDPRKISLNNIPSNFVIKWERTKDQIDALSGSERQNTYKFYDEVNGCEEGYPFFDDAGPKIIRDNFALYQGKYLQSIANRNRPREENKNHKERQKQAEYNPNETFPVLPGSYITKSNDDSGNFWSAYTGSGKIVSVVDVIKSVNINNNVSLDQQKPSSQDERLSKRKSTKYNNQHNHQHNHQHINRFQKLGDEITEITIQQEQIKIPSERDAAMYRNKISTADDEKKPWILVNFRGKKIRGNKKQYPTNKQNETSPNRDNRHKTPSRFKNRSDNNSKEFSSGSRTRTNSRRNTPTGTFSTFSKNGTPSSDGVYTSYGNNLASPNFANKNGNENNVNSPTYIQPNRQSTFKVTGSPSAKSQDNFNYDSDMELKTTPISIPPPDVFYSEVEHVEQVFENNDDDEWM